MDFRRNLFSRRSACLVAISFCPFAFPALLTAQAVTAAPAVEPTAAAPTSEAQALPLPAANALELPVLVVDHQHRPVDDVKLDRLRIKIGAGAPFTPISIRTQGEDPVSMAVLVDASRDSFHGERRRTDPERDAGVSQGRDRGYPLPGPQAVHPDDPKDAYKPGTSHGAKVSQTGVTPYFYSATGAGEPLVAK